MNKRILNYLLFIMLICLSLSSYLLLYNSDHDIYKIRTINPTFGDVTLSTLSYGEIIPENLVTVGAQVSGQITKIFIKPGDNVNEGDIIIEIDATTQKNDLAINEALLNNYIAQLNSRNIEHNIKLNNYNRQLSLYKKDIISKEQLEISELEVAKAKASVKEMESLITQTKISVGTSRANVGYTQIRSPINGKILYIYVVEGQTINAVQQTPPIALIADLNKMLLKIKISECDIINIKKGMKILYNILGTPENKDIAVLDNIYYISEDKVNNIGNDLHNNELVFYIGSAHIDNDDNKLLPHMTASCEIIYKEKENVLLLPNEVIYYENNKKFVNILDQTGDILKKYIQSGISDGKNTEIISGLSINDNIVVD